MPPVYVECHARSAFSFLEGASLPESLARQAAELEMPALALLDRDGVYGCPRLHMSAKKLGLRAHIGAEVTLHNGARLPLLAATREGYRHLSRLLTRMKLRTPKGQAAAHWEDLAAFSGGLICLTGDENGPLAQALSRGREAAAECLEQLIAIYGRHNLYVELQRHHHREQEARNQALIALARAFRLPLLATNGVTYATPAGRELQDVFTCLRHHRTLAQAGRLLSRNAERYLKSPAQMQCLFADLPEAVAHTRELSSRLEFTLADLGYEFPRYPVPPGETMDSFLRRQTMEGAARRYRPLHDKARRQLERELALIEKLGLAGYFLIVWDLVEFCRREGILVQGRGSAANSAVCYSLGITAVDPVGMDLLFERFLSEERGEWPDIDLDLPSGEARERVIQYVYARFGKLGAAMTANYITYRGRSAVREIGKVLGFDEATIARLANLVSRWGWRDPRQTLEGEFTDASLNLADPLVQKFLALCRAVRGLPRHLGQHSGGMVICQDQLDSIVPLEPATMPGRVVVQWDKEDCADLGLIKVDLLGLGMMAVIADTVQLVRRHWGEQIDLAHLPPDDPQVFQALEAADTIGMFQVESRAQMSCLPRLKPRCFYDIVVQVAIIRPGPIVGNLLHPYLRRRQGKEPVTYPHPALEPVLRRTLGVPLFQEQLLRMAMLVAGFSGGEAEELRRALGFTRSVERMNEVEVKLRRGMERNGITGEAQEQIVKSIVSFALYGFPESHAASFALLAYASAWLRTHYFPAFLAALLNNQPMGFYHPNTLVKDAQRHGVRVLAVDILHSHWQCAIEMRDGVHCVRLGFNYVKGLRQEVAEQILAARAQEPFASITDLTRRVPLLRKEELNRLAALGALNCLSDAHNHRRGALWQAARAARPAGGLLASLPEEPSPSADQPAPPCPLAPMRPAERLRADLEAAGLTVGPHPMAYLRSALNNQGVLPAARLARCAHHQPVRVAGVIICRQRPETAKGFLFLSLEDETGIANVIVTPQLFDRCRRELLEHTTIQVEGILQNLEGVVSVRAQHITPLAAFSLPLLSHDFR